MRCSADVMNNNNIKMLGSSRGLHNDIESLWYSLIPRNVSAFDRDSEEEIFKLSLLLESTKMLVTELHQKRQSSLSQLKTVSDQLKVASDLREKSESEKRTLCKELEALKSDFQSSEERAKKYQKENERLKTKVSTEVEARLHKIFNNCLHQNKAATVFDMMTQMCQENAISEGVSAVEETLPKRPYAERVAHLKSATNKISDIGSPDVIPATPPILGQKSRQNCPKFKKSRAPSYELEPTSKVESVPSSPDVIGGTPPTKNFEKDTRQRHENKKKQIFNRKEVESDSEQVPIEFVQNTEDVDESPTVPTRLVLKENVIVPATLDPDTYEIKSSKDHVKNSSQNDKENENISPNCIEEKAGKLADLSTDVEFPSTPKKSSKQGDSSKSPILGRSGHKFKTSLRLSSASAETSSCKSPRRNKESKKKDQAAWNISMSVDSKSLTASRAKNTSKRIDKSFMDDSSKISYNIGPDKKISKSRQQTLHDAFSKENHNKSKLSLSKRRKDISSRPEFKGGLRTVADTSMDFSHLTENDQVQLAIKKSMSEVPLEDSDATLFIPINSPTNLECQVVGKDDAVETKSTSAMKADETRKSSEGQAAEFAPLFSSTAKEDFTQFQQLSPSTSQVVAAIGKPLYSSTEQVSDENSALKELIELQKEMEDENEEEDMEDDHAAPFALGTSYDRLPQKNNSPNYAYKGPAVRKKKDRKNLKGFDCSNCVEYYEAAFAGDDERAKKIILDGCSRHRARAKEGPRSRTPPGYWGLDFPSTQVLRKRQQATPSPPPRK
ncbi:uncharacterized protein LOC113208748 isoform X1 [Frankliniella occidentalis]|uniref:Uncharacterized protein LOC113208748 isoform X1 n=2 Tax=Frankliniella occidentalis TaxID=133901 RepID=A0A6J1SL74_FRAOC|nr:uncharacterized protein LOC113208748 isoform X1 [Frankliniella occidentalis]